MDNKATSKPAVAAPIAESPLLVCKEDRSAHDVVTEQKAVEQGAVEQNFAEKIFALLASEEFEGIFYWLSSGEAFCVTDKNAFESKVLSKHFPTAKFDSFMRRMRRWGFTRIETTEQRSKGLIVFTNPSFRKGRPDLCKRMCDDRQKKKSKASAGRAGVHHGSKEVATMNVSPPSLQFSANLGNGIQLPSLQPTMISSIMPPIAPYYWNPSMSQLATTSFIPNAFLPVHSTLCSNFISTNLPVQTDHVSHNAIISESVLPSGINSTAVKKVDGIRASIYSIDAELAAISRLKELRRQSLSLAAMRGTTKKDSPP